MSKPTSPEMENLLKRKKSLHGQFVNAYGETKRALGLQIKSIKGQIREFKRNYGNQTNGTPAEARVSRGAF